jgi:hypothetical protein
MKNRFETDAPSLAAFDVTKHRLFAITEEDVTTSEPKLDQDGNIVGTQTVTSTELRETREYLPQTGESLGDFRARVKAAEAAFRASYGKPATANRATRNALTEAEVMG